MERERSSDERESDLEEWERKNKEKADAIRERQIRLGHVQAPEEAPAPQETSPPPKPKNGRRKKSTGE